LQLKVDDEGPKFTKISSYGRHFVWLCLINPSGDHIATLNATGSINTWAVRNGQLVCMKLLLWTNCTQYTTQLLRFFACGIRNIVEIYECLKFDGLNKETVSVEDISLLYIYIYIYI
jgi:hypothetical protein